MEVHQLKCPNCNANLEIEDDLDTFFCKYCGSKLVVTGRDEAVIKAKADVALAEKHLETNRLKYEHEERMAKENRINNLLDDPLPILAIISVLFVFFMCIYHTVIT